MDSIWHCMKGLCLRHGETVHLGVGYRVSCGISIFRVFIWRLYLLSKILHMGEIA